MMFIKSQRIRKITIKFRRKNPLMKGLDKGEIYME